MDGQKKKLYVMVGIPGSGKSTFLQTHSDFFAETYKIISRDEIRFSIISDKDEYFSKENEVFKKFIEEIKNSLLVNEETYADATHINERSRSKLLRALGKSLKNIEVNAIVIRPSLNITIEQNNKREGREFVPESAIKQMNSQFTMPTIEEGFNNIYIYKKEKENIWTFYHEKEY